MYSKYSVGIFVFLIVLGLTPVVEGQILVDKFADVQQNTSVKSTSENLLETKISVSINNQSLKNGLKKIQRKSGVHVFYTRDILRGTSNVTLKAEQQSLGKVLDQLLKPEGLDYWATGSYIILQRNEIAPILETVSGQVTDASTGDPLPGVNVVIQGTSTGTSTNTDGAFELNVPSLQDTLVFSFIGYQTREIPIDGRTTINITLSPDVAEMEGLVVTSFGIRKTKQELTYSTQEVEGENLTKAGNTDVLYGLQGKVAGVDVNLQSGMPGRSPTIHIRGANSFTGNNEPLYIIDGSPVSGRPLDLNPSDIANMNVLKGPTASALYGLRASNGVVVITTKSGQAIEGEPQISFETFTSLDQVGMLPDLQETYAQGRNGNFMPGNSLTWGPKISEVGTYTNQLGEQETARSYDNDKEFFQNGNTSNLNLSVAKSAEFGDYYVGVGHSRQTGIVPTTGLTRSNIKLKGTYNIREDLTTSVSLNFTDTEVEDYPDLEGNTDYFRGLRDVPPSYNLAGKPISYEDNPYRQRYFRASQNNPYWALEHNFRTNNTRRFFGNALVNYSVSDNLSFNYRFGVDHFNTSEVDFRELGTGPDGRTNPPSGGQLRMQDITSSEINSNFYLSYQQQLGESFSLDITAGNEIFDQRRDFVSPIGQNFVAGGWPNLDNATLINTSNSASDQRIVGFYGNLDLGWQEKIFLNVTGRNDVVSNMPEGNRSFFYPSLGTSFILTELIPGLQNFMSFGKLRATVAEAGQAGPLYVNETGFVTTNPGSFQFPYNGLSSFTRNPVRIDPNLEPENTRSFEIGFDLRFLDERIGIDYTYYSSISEGQIFNVPLPPTTGASSEIRNAGEMSSNGHEVILNLYPVQTPNFSWNLITNFTSNENKVEELAEGIEQININNNIIVAQEGFDYPSIFGRAYFKDPETGKTVVQSDPNDPGYGMPILNPEQQIIGSPLPDFRMSFTNNFSYRDFSLSFQIDWRSGGKMFSQSFTESRWRGTNGVTSDREQEQVLENTVKGHIENGELIIDGANDIPIIKDFRYYTQIGRWLPTEQSLQDASFFRLRELTFTYNLSQRMLRNLPINDASVYFTGRNLFLITDSFTDPEVNHSNDRSSNTIGLEWSQIPQTKSYGLGLRVKF